MTSHVQQIMEQLLAKYNRFPFQDDVAIPTKHGGDHDADVLQILQILTYEAGLQLRLHKCKFYMREAHLLGNLITPDGIQMDPQKVQSVLAWPQPKDGKAMQCFLGAVNFHREFSQQFTKILAPLEDCCNVSGDIHWTLECTQAFENIKQ